MSHYNIAVTVGPNIFRPKEIKPADLINAGTFYDVMIRFMTITYHCQQRARRAPLGL